VVGITIYVSQAVLFWSPRWAKPLSFASAFGVIFSVGGIIVFCRNLAWFDHVEPPENQPLALHDVKDFLRLLPLIVCSQMAYGCLYMTMKIWYGRQACQMDFRYWPVGPPELNDPMLFPAFFADIHPRYEEITARCSCGNEIKTRSTVCEDILLDVCSQCHPFFTGKQKILDTGGRVDRFNKRFAGRSLKK